VDTADVGQGGIPAADVFAAELHPRRGGWLLQRARVAGAFVSELMWELVPSPSVHDVVVTRRDDGAEVLRVEAGDPFQEGDALARMRAELERLPAEEFLARWQAVSPPRA